MTNENNPIEGALYAAKVVDQLLTVDKNGDVLLIVNIERTALITDEGNPTEGRTTCPAQEHEVRISLPSSEPERQRLEIGLKNLSKFGVEPADIPRLHADHSRAILLTGREVYVRPKVSGGNIYWNLAWPRERPRPVAVGTLEAATANLLSKLSAAREGKTAQPRDGRSRTADNKE